MAKMINASEWSKANPTRCLHRQTWEYAFMCFLPHARRLMVSVLAALLLGALATAAHAAEPPLTLEAAVQRGVARAPQLDARAADTAAAREETARAGPLPDPTLPFQIGRRSGGE